MNAFQKEIVSKVVNYFTVTKAYIEILNPRSRDTGTFRLIGYQGPILMLLIKGTHRNDIEESNDMLFSFNDIARIICSLQLHYGAKPKRRIGSYRYNTMYFSNELVNILNIHIVFFSNNSSNFCHDTSGENLKCLLRFITRTCVIRVLVREPNSNMRHPVRMC